VSGSCDSIRERRARESWEEWEGETTQTKTTLGMLVAMRLLHLEEQEEAIKKVYEGRLSIQYFRWNGRTDNDRLVNDLLNGGIIGLC